jgi:hypothetical protein
MPKFGVAIAILRGSPPTMGNVRFASSSERQQRGMLFARSTGARPMRPRVSARWWPRPDPFSANLRTRRRRHRSQFTNAFGGFAPSRVPLALPDHGVAHAASMAARLPVCRQRRSGGLAIPAQIISADDIADC